MRHIFKVTVFLMFAILLLTPPLFAKDRYWVGGNGNWSDNANHWSKNSGGAPGDSKPDDKDTAIFDSNSGGGTCTVDEAVDVKGFEMRAGNSTTFSQGANTVTVGKDDAALTSGTFEGGSANINFDDKSTLAGATFNNTTAILTCKKEFKITGGTFEGGSGTINCDDKFTLEGGTFNNTSATMTCEKELKVDGGIFNAASSTIDANDNFKVESGSFSAVTATITVGKDFKFTGGSLILGTSPLTFDGNDNADFVPGAASYYDIIINKDSDSKRVVVSGTATVTNDLTLTNGKLNDDTVNVQENITIDATADGGTATISLTGTGIQTITGNDGGIFVDTLDINKTSDTATITGTCSGIQDITVTQGTLDFDGGFTYTIDHLSTVSVASGATILFTGSSGNLVTLRSSDVGNDWSLNVDNDASYTADFVDVSNSDASGGQTIFATESTDSGSNQNWFFVDKFVFLTDAFKRPVNQISPTITVQAQQTDGTPSIAPTAGVILILSTTSGGGEFSLLSDPFVPITQITIADGSSSVNFFYRDSIAGNPLITLTEQPDILKVENATQAETIIPTAGYRVEASTPQIAGQAFNLTITAIDASGGVDPLYTFTANISITYVSPNSGTFSIDPASTSDFVNGIATVSATYSDCGTISIVAIDSLFPTITGTRSNVLFLPFDFLVAASGMDTPTRHTVNRPFVLTITARNASAGTCPNYKGLASLSVKDISPPSNQSGTLNITSLINDLWINGVSTITNQIYNKWGTVTIVATDATLNSQTGESPNIDFVPKDFFIVLSDPPASRTFYYTNEEFSATVTARDHNDDAVDNYQGTIEFADSDLNLPEDYTFTITDTGIHEFDGINSSDEIETTFSVNDATFTSLVGESEIIIIKEGIIKVNSAAGPVGSIRTTVEILDSDGNILTEDNSTTFTILIDEVIENGTASSTTTTSPVTVTNGVGEITITDTEGETVTVTPLSTPTLTPISGSVTFGTISGTGLGVELWREIRSPREYEEKE